MIINDFKFYKEFRISKKKEIDFLFNTNNSFLVFPFKVVWCEYDNEKLPARILISVPKNKIQKAYKRNKIKRLTRESFRKNKNSFFELLEHNNKKILMAFVYIHKDILTYSEVEEAVVKIFKKLSFELKLK
jgi:ribonuclease P protein component